MDEIRLNILKSQLDIMDKVNPIKANEIRKSIQNELEKARSGVYKNNSENRKRNIVGLKYGNTKKEEPTFVQGSTEKDFDKFRDCLSKLPESLKVFITDYSSKEYIKKGAKCYLTPNGKSGFVVTGDKDIISVFSLPGERMGEYALFNAVRNGGRTLDCIHPKLVEIYTKYGFKEESRIKWDDNYAPPNWDYSKNGRPDVVFMKFNK